MEQALSPADISLARSSPGRWRTSVFARLLRIKIAVFGMVTIAIVVLAAIFAPMLAPFGPTQLAGPAAAPPFTGRHVLGTDALGRDQLTRLMYGARASLRVSLLAVAISVSVGSVLGLVAAYFRGAVDSVLMRIIDAMLSLPGLVLPLTLLSVLGGGVLTVSIALGIAFIPVTARLMRGQALSQLGRDYVLSARATGANHSRIMLRHIAPNCFAPIIVQASLQMSVAVIAEAGLGFLGVGVTPPTPTWGNMLSTGLSSIRSEPWIVYGPAAAIFLLVLAFNFIGDALRDVLDPRLRGAV
jgi:ABC-type dipeptide/oligopeptide/nickel transport system permease subunit